MPDADEPALVNLLGVGDCIGTLIAPAHLLTVARCAELLRVGDPLVVAGVDHAVAEVILHPDWQRFPDDIAVVRLDGPVVGVDLLPLYPDTGAPTGTRGGDGALGAAGATGLRPAAAPRGVEAAPAGLDRDAWATAPAEREVREARRGRHRLHAVG